MPKFQYNQEYLVLFPNKLQLKVIYILTYLRRVYYLYKLFHYRVKRSSTLVLARRYYNINLCSSNTIKAQNIKKTELKHISQVQKYPRSLLVGNQATAKGILFFDGILQLATDFWRQREFFRYQQLHDFKNCWIQSLKTHFNVRKVCHQIMDSENSFKFDRHSDANHL